MTPVLGERNGKLSILKSEQVHSVLKKMLADSFIVSSW